MLDFSFHNGGRIERTYSSGQKGKGKGKGSKRRKGNKGGQKGKGGKDKGKGNKRQAESSMSTAGWD